jgi:hypothetical protein
MLALLRFIGRLGIADFSADTNSKLTIDIFSFYFKYLRCNHLERRTSARYGVGRDPASDHWSRSFHKA